ncbi:MAG: hypothetical protein Q7S56_01660 [Nanoarchaeota archaeon]|nr:hypothetical protein [Nanoarchaeota archaeon]
MKKQFFTLSKWVIVSTVILFILNVILILQLIPVLESQTLNAKIVNAIVSPPNFIIEDLLGINSIKFFDILTWILQFIYDYILILIIRYIIK